MVVNEKQLFSPGNAVRYANIRPTQSLSRILVFDHIYFLKGLLLLGSTDYLQRVRAYSNESPAVYEFIYNNNLALFLVLLHQLIYNGPDKPCIVLVQLGFDHFRYYNRVCKVITINNVIGVGVEYGPITDLYLHSVPGHQSQQFT